MKINITKLARKMTLKAYRLDTSYQNHRILRAGVNLHLAHLFRSDSRNKVFPGELQNGELALRNCNIKVNISELTANFAAIQRNDFKSLSFTLQSLCSRADMKYADEIMVRLAGLTNPVRICRTQIKDFSDKMSSAEQEAILEEYDRQTTCQLAPYFNLENSPVAPLHLPETSGIRPFYMFCYTNEKDCITPFCNEAGSILYYVVRKNLHGHNVELPITNYICGSGDEFPVYRMPDLGNGGMFPLYALDKLKDFPETPVILTDILEIASEFNKPSEDLIVSSFYGSIDAIPQTDIRPLFGSDRKTYWLLLNRPGCQDSAETYRTGLKMMEKFCAYDRNINLIEPVDNKWITSKISTFENASVCKSDFREVTRDQFLMRCSAMHIRVPELLDIEEPNILSGSAANQVADDVPFITPIAYKGGFVIIYATAKAGKTFFALHMAISMAYGKDPVPGYWTNAIGKPCKVLYISGEMTKSQFKKRKLREEAILKPNESMLDNISFLHERGRYLDNPESQKYFDRAISMVSPDMIILDNWQTLTSPGATTRGAFDEFFKWIGKWCDRGIQITLINHTNKSGKIVGSGAQSGACDTSIRLYKANVDDTIRILVTPEDFRDGKRSLFCPILASYDIDNPTAGWKFETRDAEYVEAIKKWNEDDGCAESKFPGSSNSDAEA